MIKPKTKRVSALEIAQYLGSELHGVNFSVKGISSLETPKKGTLSFAKNSEYLCRRKLDIPEPFLVICPEDSKIEELSFSIVHSNHPRKDFTRVYNQFFIEEMPHTIHPNAVIEKKAKIGKNVGVGPNSYIGNCEIGDNTMIDGNAFIYTGTKLGKNVIINAGTVIGADGMGYERDENGVWMKFPQLAGVVIGDNVEVGSNTSIMKGALYDTFVGEETKIGHLCTIGHGVRVGKNCLITTQSMLGGSCQIGDYAQIAFGACVRNAIKIGKHAFVGMGAVATKDVEDGWLVMGIPARRIRKI